MLDAQGLKWTHSSVVLTVCCTKLYCTQLPSSLDFLDGVPELQDWYTDGFVFHRNPFSVAVCCSVAASHRCGVCVPPRCTCGPDTSPSPQLPIDERPPTPRNKGRKVLIDGEYREVEFPSLVAGHALDVRFMKVRPTPNASRRLAPRPPLTMGARAVPASTGLWHSKTQGYSSLVAMCRASHQDAGSNSSSGAGLACGGVRSS